MSTVRTIQTVQKKLTVSPADLHRAIVHYFGITGTGVSVSVQVPTGGDYSGELLDLSSLDPDARLEVRWEQTTADEGPWK